MADVLRRHKRPKLPLQRKQSSFCLNRSKRCTCAAPNSFSSTIAAASRRRPTPVRASADTAAGAQIGQAEGLGRLKHQGRVLHCECSSGVFVDVWC